MNEPRPDFFDRLHPLPRINREGRRFGIPAFVAAAALALAAAARTTPAAMHGGAKAEVREGQIMAAGDTVLGHLPGKRQDEVQK